MYFELQNCSWTPWSQWSKPENIKKRVISSSYKIDFGYNELSRLNPGLKEVKSLRKYSDAKDDTM